MSTSAWLQRIPRGGSLLIPLEGTQRMPTTEDQPIRCLLELSVYSPKGKERSLNCLCVGDTEFFLRVGREESWESCTAFLRSIQRSTKGRQKNEEGEGPESAYAGTLSAKLTASGGSTTFSLSLHLHEDGGCSLEGRFEKAWMRDGVCALSLAKGISVDLPEDEKRQWFEKSAEETREAGEAYAKSLEVSEDAKPTGMVPRDEGRLALLSAWILARRKIQSEKEREREEKGEGKFRSSLPAELKSLGSLQKDLLKHLIGFMVPELKKRFSVEHGWSYEWHPHGAECVFSPSRLKVGGVVVTGSPHWSLDSGGDGDLSDPAKRRLKLKWENARGSTRSGMPHSAEIVFNPDMTKFEGWCQYPGEGRISMRGTHKP